MTGTLIVGSSIGGVRTAQQLRRQGYTAPIALVDREPHLPYDRPPLSKAVLSDEQVRAPALLTREQAADLGIELILGREAVGADLPRRTVRLSDDRSIPFRDALVVATGARARQPPWEGVGLLELRGWEDALRVRAALESARSLVIIGAGFIGAEVASAARERGLLVDLVDTLAVPMGRHFGPDVGSRFVNLHHVNGVSTHFGTGVASLSADAGGIAVVLDDGTRITADEAVVGLGTELNTGWLEGSGVVLDDGVVCDSACRAEGVEGVFAVGDAAKWWHPGLGQLTRSEHWTNAVEQAAVVAHNIAHPQDPRTHAPIGYVWSNQYDWKIQMAGEPARGVRQVVVDGDNRFAALWGDARGRACGLVTVNWPALAVRGRKALSQQASFEVARDLMFPPERRPAQLAATNGEST